MRVHEYQGKEILRGFGIPTLRGRVAFTADEARDIAVELASPVVVKAQVHAGGRGKGGGIALADSPEDAGRAASLILGMTLVTPQTGPQGRLVRKVLVEEQAGIASEYYLSILIDRALGRPLIIASSAGGMEIEAAAAETPEMIHRVVVDPAIGFQPYHARSLGFALGIPGGLMSAFVEMIGDLYRAFSAKDCLLAEINPLVVTKSGGLLALDVKMDFDDNALFRHPELAELRDPGEEDRLEVEAQKLGINNYVKLTGNIGCIVNGAGLAMATMDAIKLAGGDPANFLDIGTVNDAQRVVNAFRILTADESVHAILVNIFGGLARVDVVAEGIVEAHRQLNVRVPVVVRLAGTNREEGDAILDQAEMRVVRVIGLAEAANKAVSAAQG